MNDKILDLSLLGDTAESDRFDLLIYVPHAELYHPDGVVNDLLPRIRTLDPTALEEFCYMDADTGSRELAHDLGNKLAGKWLKVAILDVRVPRSIIDFNRSFERSMPEIWRNEELSGIFRSSHSQIQKYFEQSRHTLHLHTMASHERTELWEPESTEEFTLERVRSYAENAYRGTPRKFNQLTGDKSGNRYVDAQLTELVETALSQAGYEHAQNEAYSLEPCYPTTECLRKNPGSAFDIVKKYVASPETMDGNNPGTIVIDPVAVDRLGSVLASAYAEYLG